VKKKSHWEIVCGHKSWLHKWLFSESWCWCASGIALDDANKRYFPRRFLITLLLSLCSLLFVIR
jgi:hypothetical protein